MSELDHITDLIRKLREERDAAREETRYVSSVYQKGRDRAAKHIKMLEDRHETIMQNISRMESYKMNPVTIVWDKSISAEQYAKVLEENKELRAQVDRLTLRLNGDYII